MQQRQKQPTKLVPRSAPRKKSCYPATNDVKPVNSENTLTRQQIRASIRDIVKSDTMRKFSGTMSRRARRGIAHTIAGNAFRKISAEAKESGNTLGFLFARFVKTSIKMRGTRQK